MAELERIPMMDKVFDIWRRRKWLLIVSFLSVFTAAVFLVAALPPLYRSSTTILFGQDDIAESLLKTGSVNELEMRLGVIRQAVMSRSQLQEVVDKLNLYASLKDHASPESVIDRFRKDVRIEQRAFTEPQWGQRSSYAITITYQDWDPERAALVANELAARYRAENERIRTGHAVSGAAFVSEQLEAARARLETQEQRINDFRNAHLGELPEQQEFNMATLDRLNSELRLNGERQVFLLERRDGMRPGARSTDPSAGLAGLTGVRRLEWLKRDLAELETRLTPNHPDIIRVSREIDALTLELAGAGSGGGAPGDPEGAGRGPTDIEGELQALRREEIRLRASIARLVQTLEGTPKIEQELKRFAYDYDTAKNEYLKLRELYQEAYLAESLETRQNQQFKIIEVAIPPDGPVAPDRPKLFLLGFMLALGAAAAALFLVEQLDRSFHSIDGIRAFTGVAVLAGIPRILTPGDQWRSRMRFTLVSVCVVAGLAAVAGSGYFAGTHGEPLVWAFSH